MIRILIVDDQKVDADSLPLATPQQFLPPIHHWLTLSGLACLGIFIVRDDWEKVPNAPPLASSNAFELGRWLKGKGKNQSFPPCPFPFSLRITVHLCR